MARIRIEGLPRKKVSAHRGPPPWHRQSGKNRKMTAGKYRKNLARGVERSSVPTSERPRGGGRSVAALGFATVAGARPGGVGGAGTHRGPWAGPDGAARLRPPGRP